jgi:hypothetical protein
MIAMTDHAGTGDDQQPTLRRVLGESFDRIHPRIRAQYSLTSRDNAAWIGRGIMEEMRPGRFYTRPFLRIGALRRVMFPETGRDVPFTIANYAYVDSFGRETLTWTRMFELPTVRRFDETLIYSEKRSSLLVYAGTHQHLAVELAVSVSDDGSLCFRTGAQRIYEGRLAFRMPLLFSGVADVRESYSEARSRFEIDVRIENRVFGPIFGYRGWFHLERVSCAAAHIPAGVRPTREERRE